jgi:peptide/nickel transport system substrate-binding protein
MSDINMRKAVLFALDQGEIMVGACAGNEDMYSVAPNWGTTGSIYESTTGKDVYNHQDLEKSKEYLREAGYNGETLVVYTNGSYATDKNAALVVAQQLREVGINIDLRAPDWPTVVQARQDPTAFDMIVSGYSMKPDPTLIAFTNIGWPGWWDTDTRMDLYYKLLEETDQTKRAKIWNDFTELIWSELPVIKLGDFYGAIGYLKNVHNIPVKYPWRRFYWNTWME